MTKECAVCYRPMSNDKFPKERVCDRCAGIAPPAKKDLEVYFAAARKLYDADIFELQEANDDR